MRGVEAFLKSLAALAGVARERGVQPSVRFELGEVAGRTLYSYVVGAYTLSLVDSGREVVYVASPQLSRDLLTLVEARLGEITVLMKKGNDLGDVLAEVLGIGRGEVAEAIYALRSAVWYRRLQVLLEDPYITDISVAGPGSVWVKHSWVEENIPSQDFIRTNVVLNSFEEVGEKVEKRVGGELDIQKFKVFLEDPRRIDEIAKYIANHFLENLDGRFKAMVVAASRKACVLYKKALDKYLPPEYSEVVMTFQSQERKEVIEE